MRDERAGTSPAHGAVGYLQLPADDLEAAKSFYENVFGWEGETGFGSFSGPGIIGQWTGDLRPSPSAGPVLWLCVDHLGDALRAVVGPAAGCSPGRTGPGARWLVEVADPAGNRLGLFARADDGAAADPPRRPRRRGLEPWYAEVVGLVPDHGGAEYERLLADGELVLQLHRRDVEHHHGSVVEDDDVPVGNASSSGSARSSTSTPSSTGRPRAASRSSGPSTATRRPVGARARPTARCGCATPDGYTVVVASRTARPGRRSRRSRQRAGPPGPWR